MESNFYKVKTFMLHAEQTVKDRPAFNMSLAEFRYSLIEEEVGELLEAIDERHMTEIADALTDILYVVYGTGHALGIDLDACFNEVHRSNMSKFENGKPVKNEYGKVMKGKNYSPPDLASVLLNQGSIIK